MREHRNPAPAPLRAAERGRLLSMLHRQSAKRLLRTAHRTRVFRIGPARVQNAIPNSTKVDGSGVLVYSEKARSFEYRIDPRKFVPEPRPGRRTAKHSSAARPAID